MVLKKVKRNMERKMNEAKNQRRERIRRLKAQKHELKMKLKEVREKQRAKHQDEVRHLPVFPIGLITHTDKIFFTSMTAPPCQFVTDPPHWKNWRKKWSLVTTNFIPIWKTKSLPIKKRDFPFPLAFWSFFLLAYWLKDSDKPRDQSLRHRVAPEPGYNHPGFSARR